MMVSDLNNLTYKDSVNQQTCTMKSLIHQFFGLSNRAEQAEVNQN